MPVVVKSGSQKNSKKETMVDPSAPDAVVPIQAANKQTYYQFPYLNNIPLGQHPRIYIRNDLSNLQIQYSLQTREVALFKYEINKLMGYSSACSDWRCGNGWPAATLSLAYLVTGNLAYGQKVCDVFLSNFQGQASGDFSTDVYFALAYDWLYNHPCFTTNKKADLRLKLISWSNGTAKLDESSSWLAHDSDRNIAATSGHFIAGLAILDEDYAMGKLLLSRGWTGWKYGINTNIDLPNFPVSKLFSSTLETGIPLPGWDYGLMGDVKIAQNLFYALDELGVIDAEFPSLKLWWVNSLESMMRNIDPGNTHYHWVGDQQMPNGLDDCGCYILSYSANCIFLAEKYGYSQVAARGRYFLDNILTPSWGTGEADPLLLFVRSYSSSAPRLNPTTDLMKRYSIGGYMSSQAMGLASFRSAWKYTPAGTTVTWGGFFGIGSYIQDHQHNIAGSFFIWRNGEYLLTEPRNYGGNEAGILWNSLAIPNSAGMSPDNEGPIVYWNQAPAYIERGRTMEIPTSESDLMYVMLNADHSYNLYYNQWASCQTCRTPVKNYTRHFVYDGGDFAFVLDRVAMTVPAPVKLRFRSQNNVKLPSMISANLITLPSEKGNYRTLIKVLSPSSLPNSWTIQDEKVLFANVDDWQIDNSQFGGQIKTSFASLSKHRIISVLNFDVSGNTQLDDAKVITSADSMGACAGKICVVIALDNGILRSSVQYITPSTTAANSRHMVGDMSSGVCLSATGSVDGLLASDVFAKSNDNTFVFKTISSGIQTITIATCSGTPTPTVTKTQSPTASPSKPVTKSPSNPTNIPTKSPSKPITIQPTKLPTIRTNQPTKLPTTTKSPTTKSPTTNSPSIATSAPSKKRRRKRRGL